MNAESFRVGRRGAIRTLGAVVSGLAMGSTLGCTKLIVGGGKLLFGDPKLPSEFTSLTKEDLTKGLKTVLVICSTPESMEDDISTLRLDLIDGVTRRLGLNGVKIINPDRVADWIDEHEASISDPNELAHDFETDYIAWIDVHAFSLHEPNSPKLLRGQTTGLIRVFKVVEENSDRRNALKVYQTEFTLVYPQHQPISIQGRGVDVFARDYVKRLCDHLAEKFYDHRPGTTF